MMQRRKKDIILLCASIASFFLMTFMFMLSPLDFPNVKPQTLNIINGSVFWGFMIIGIALQALLSKRRNQWIIKNHLQRDSRFRYSKIGITTFAQNLYGIIADISFLVSLVVLVISYIITKGYGYICSIALTTTVFTFCLHCILNGRIFFYVLNQDNILSETERSNQTKE